MTTKALSGLALAPLRLVALGAPLGLVALGAMLGCSGKLDAGYDTPHGQLPVDERSAMVVLNDGPRDNWQGEYAVVLAAAARLQLVGIVVDGSGVYPDLQENVAGFRRMIQAARESGMQGLPDPTASVSRMLVRPATGSIDDTIPNRSEGARLILDAAARYGSEVHPLVIATGSPVTDVADAYLMDPTLPERAVVVSSLGSTANGGAVAGSPNGDTDAWATVIVTNRMRYVQVNAFYDQLQDVPEERISELPQNPFGDWMAEKQPEILDLIVACDQISVLAAALPWFASSVTRMRAEPGDDIPMLTPDPAGQIWHVPEADTDAARDDFWRALQDPATYQ